MTRGAIKKEPDEVSAIPKQSSMPAPSPSRRVAPSIGSNTMGPPARRRAAESQDMDGNHSAVMSFFRSDAPSADTHRFEHDEDSDPILLQIKGPVGGHVDSPSSQSLDANFAHQSFAHPTFTDIGMKLRAFNDTLGDLQRLGVSHVAALPELVLVGDQSAGKSSLMSGLARVNLPRSAGVGTRCPLHIRLIASTNAHWSCAVSLQQDYDFRPRGKIKKSDVTSTNPFPPWVKKSHRDTKIFKTIFDPNEIEEVLRWAQVAILNPNTDHELYIPGEGAVAKDKSLDVATRTAAAQFSPNIISLEIKGPELPDLSFYDLPGVFLSPDQEEDEYIVKVVRNLTRDYIRRETAIIMWALPMNADPENSISLGIIREARAADRTIGIMTKADKLAPENEAQWLAMFRGEKQSVGHGFFATSRPPDEPLETAGKLEELFFTHEVGSWPTQFDDFKNRCGVDLLGKYISTQLGDAFARSLPSIKKKVLNRLEEVKLQLKDLPELPSNVEHEVKKSLYNFLGRMKMAVRESDFSSEWGALNNQFRDIIVKIKPTCRVTEPAAQIIDLSDADTESQVGTPTKRPRPSDSTVRANTTPNKRQRQEAEAPVTPVKQETTQTSGLFRASSIASNAIDPQSPFNKFRNLGRRAMDIRDIRNHVRRMQRPGLPRDLVPDGVRESMCLDAVKKWKGPLDTYIDKTAELLEKVTDHALEVSLGILRRRLIFKECQAHLKAFIEQAVTSQRAKLSELYDAETYQMYMMNEDAFSRYRAQELDQLRRARAICRLQGLALFDWEYKVKKLEDMTDEEKSKEHKQLSTHLPKIGKDPYDTEIEVAAFVRGYYMTAAMRFVEGVTMNVNSFLLRTMGSSELDYFMDSQLGLSGRTDSKVYEHLMDEDEITARQREHLRGELEKLSEAMRSINSLESSSNSPASQETVVHDPFEDFDEIMDDEEV